MPESLYEELPISVQLVIEKCKYLCENGRMLRSEMRAFIRSVSWQSKKLKTFFDRYDKVDESFETLSEEDMCELRARCFLEH